MKNGKTLECLAKGANPNAMGKNSEDPELPIIWRIPNRRQNGAWRLCLLEHGANWNVKDEKGFSVIDHAYLDGDEASLKFLQEKGEKVSEHLLLKNQK